MNELNSLQDFITQIDQLKGQHWYYRGESKDYGDTKNLASGYRWIKDNDKVFMDLINLRKEFFREVGTNLSRKEVENFLSYSQHHGLPTELLDITLNPLVALYFACESNYNEDGFIYLFNNSIYDANNELYDSRQFQYSSYRDLTEILFSENISQQKIWFRWYPNIDDDMIDKDLMEQANQFTGNLFQGSEIFRIQHQNGVEWNKFSEKYPELAEVSTDITKLISDIRNQDNELNQKFESIINLTFKLIDLTNGRYFPNLRYLLIKPTIIFDRMKNQDGFFIYQLSTSTGFDKGYIQPIIPSATMKISKNSKRKILNQLDQIGINKKFLYSDDDSVAEYLKNNYKESFYQRAHPFG